MRPSIVRRWHRNAAQAMLTTVAFALALAVIVFSPLLFVHLSGRTSKWADLANVGQAYGGIAAVLSGMALAGVALSLMLQWRQTRTQTILALRQRHFDLVKLGIDDPRLLGRTAGGVHDAETTLLYTHANLWVAHWAMLWDLRQCDRTQLRELASQLFQGEAARDWWAKHGSLWSMSLDRRRRIFQEILSDECERARQGAAARVDMPKPRSAPENAVIHSDRRPTSRTGTTAGLVAAGAVATIILAARRQRARARTDRCRDH